MVTCINEDHGEWWTNYNGDCIEIARQLPSNSVHFNVHSPPFSNLYTYSNSERDLGNSLDDAQFMEHYRYLVREQLRVLMPGRLVAVHCKQLVDYAGRDGRAGLRDFRGEIIRLYESEGFKFHSEITIWKCPVTEMQRTKAHGLLYKQLRADSSFSRQGMAEYVLAFRKWAAEGAEVQPVTKTEQDFSIVEWQQYASPVWVLTSGEKSADGLAFAVPVADVDGTDVLNVQAARDDKDEKHMCPLALPIIERCVRLWSNPGDVVWSPFSGVGSEGVGAMKIHDATGALRPRRFIGTELKPSYWRRACANLRAAEPNAAGSQVEMFR